LYLHNCYNVTTKQEKDMLPTTVIQMQEQGVQFSFYVSRSDCRMGYCIKVSNDRAPEDHYISTARSNAPRTFKSMDAVTDMIVNQFKSGFEYHG